MTTIVRDIITTEIDATTTDTHATDDDAQAAVYAADDVLAFRMNNAGAAPPRMHARASTRDLEASDIAAFRMNNGGLSPAEVAARAAAKGTR